ncbi:MAG: hypothetical protein AB4372_40605 [Xenococcus sp. (in: cyanobacteria)]
MARQRWTSRTVQFSTDLRIPYEDYPAWALAIGWVIAICPSLAFLLLLMLKQKEA